MIDDGDVARFGAALAWAWREGADFDRVDVLMEESVPGTSAGAAVIARRAGELAAPPGVWVVRGRELERAPAGAAPVDLPVDVRWADLLIAHGAEPVIEHGVLRGEVLGLEVARVVDGELQVGVGRHDRIARLEMRPGEDPGDALDEAVSAVRERRRPGAARHPANTLARARWLRSVVCSSPGLAGASSLRAVAPPLPWFDLPEAGAAPCVGVDSLGDPVVVVCSTGVDVDLVPTAADCRRLYSPGAELVLVVPEGDDLPVTRALAGSLVRPSSVRTVPRTWEELSPASGP
jgi:hypothetical protein